MKTYYFLLPDLAAGGAERVSVTIARILNNQGKSVEFINLGYEEGEMKDWVESEFVMTSLGCSRVSLAFGKLYKFLKDRPNAVLYSSREHLSVVSIIVAKRLHIPIIVRIPNMPNNKLAKNFIGKLKENIIKSINKRILPYAKHIIAQNDEMRVQLVNYYGLSQDRVVAINNPVDKAFIVKSAENSENPFPNNCVNFLSVCNVSYAKGIDVLLESFKNVKQAIPNAHLTIVGRISTSYANKFLELTKGNSSVTFVGFQSNPYSYLKYCDVFVLPSRMEGFPNVVLEAMCFDKPIAATTCVDVIKQIITNGKNGYYCNIEDPVALSKCMIKAYKLHSISNSYGLFEQSKLLSLFE